MSDPDLGDRSQDREPPLVKSESSASGPPPAPGLIPLARPDTAASVMSAEKQQVQAAMAMAAFYSQNPLWQAAMARERLQQQQQQLGAAAAALSQLPGRAPLPGPLGLPGLAGLLNTAVTSPGPGLGPLGGLGLPGLPLPGADSAAANRTDLFRDYLSKLAQSSLTSPTSIPQYLSSVSTSSILKADDIKTENPLPASLRPGRTSTSSNRRSTSPGSSSNERQGYLASPGGAAGFLAGPGSPYFSLQRSLVSSEAQAKPPATTRSPPSGGRGRNGNSSGREKVFTCGVCNRSFGYKHVLQNHERTHTGEKPFECKECHKRFTRDHHLKTHMRLHTGEKPYSCPHCDRQFVQVANLRRHVRVHTGERPYKCELCKSDFSDSNQLKAHLLMHKQKGQNFNTLKEELLLRHSLAAGAGFPGMPLPQALPVSLAQALPVSLAQSLPQYPPVPSLLTTVQQPLVDPGQEDGSHPSLSPDSKETNGSGAGDSPGHNENLSDTNSEKRRSRKQKPRKMIFGEGERDDTTETEEEGSSASRDRSPRERHASSSSYPGREEQQEPEDLTVRPGLKKEAATAAAANYLASYRAATAISEFGLRRDNADLEEAGLSYTPINLNTNRHAKPARNRSEGSEGSLSASDPMSAHSTPNEKFRSDDLEDGREDEERGVSPPMSHPSMYNQLFGGSAAAAIQLGLSGAAVPLRGARDYIEKEGEMLAMVTHKEISQQ